MTVSEVGREKPPYRDPARTVDERVDDLLGRLTLEEKVAQLGSRWVWELADDQGRLRPEANVLLRDGLGQVTRVAGASGLGPEQVAELANTLQRTLVEETRLGIPAIVHEEICSGLMARDATVFPQAIGLASTWEPALLEELADAVRTQMRATGAHQGLGPVLDVCRDPRWGRLEETFGEDPYLVARMGVAFVRGLQGTDPATGVIATAKHLVGYGASEGGRNWAPAQIPPRELHDVYLHPFEAVVRDAGVRSVMNAYNEIDGVPCAADHELLTTLLREEWGFDGCVVADYFSVRQLADYHRFALDAADAAAQALEAGLDVELPSTDCYGTPLLDAVQGRRRQRGDGRHRGPPGAAIEVRARAVRAAVRPVRRGSRDEQHAGAAQARPHDGAQEPRPPPERRHPAARGLGRLRGRDRPVRRGCPQPVRRLRVPRARRVAAGAARQRRRSVRTRDTRRGRGAGVRRRRADGARRPPRAARVAGAVRAGLRRRGPRTRRLRRGGRPRAGGRRGGAGRGRQVRPDRRLHERRDPRPCVARPARRAAGARPRRPRDGHPGRAGARRRQALRRGGAARGLCRGAARVAPRPGGRRRDRGRARRGVQPGREAAGLVSAVVRPAPRLLRAQDLGRTVALEGRLRGRADGAPLPVRPRPLLHDLRAARRRRPPRRGLLVGDGHRRRHRREHRRPRRRRGRPALRPRHGSERDEARARAQELRPRRAARGWVGNRHVRRPRRPARVPRA